MTDISNSTDSVQRRLTRQVQSDRRAGDRAESMNIIHWITLDIVRRTLFTMNIQGRLPIDALAARHFAVRHRFKPNLRRHFGKGKRLFEIQIWLFANWFESIIWIIWTSKSTKIKNQLQHSSPLSSMLKHRVCKSAHRKRFASETTSSDFKRMTSTFWSATSRSFKKKLWLEFRFLKLYCNHIVTPSPLQLHQNSQGSSGCF